jgi:hypothetical protein
LQFLLFSSSEWQRRVPGLVVRNADVNNQRFSALDMLHRADFEFSHLETMTGFSHEGEEELEVVIGEKEPEINHNGNFQKNDEFGRAAMNGIKRYIKVSIGGITCKLNFLSVVPVSCFLFFSFFRLFFIQISFFVFLFV